MRVLMVGEAVHVWGQDAYEKSLYFQFYCELKTALKSKIFKIINQ